MDDFNEYIKFMHLLADSADSITLDHFRKELNVENKESSGFDPVTVADQYCEKKVRELIELEYPEHGIIGEEFGQVRSDSEFVWVLDPIDGTRAYVTGLPVWGTLIGLTRHGQAVAGMMSQPFTRERYFGEMNGAFLLHDDKITTLNTRHCKSLGDSTLLTTSPYLFDPNELKAFKKIESMVKTHRFGTDCYGYAMLASGHADLVIESGLQPYDIAALIPIIEGAGGVVTDWQGERADQGGQILACGNQDLHELVLCELNWQMHDSIGAI